MAIVALSLLPSQSSPFVPNLPSNPNNFPPIKQSSLVNYTHKNFSSTHLRKNHQKATQLVSGGGVSGGDESVENDGEVEVGGGSGSGSGGDSDDGGGGGGGDSGSGGHGDHGGEGEKNRAEAWLAAAEAHRTIDSLPKDMALAANEGLIPGAIVRRYFELEKSPVLKWLLQFGGFKERLLADDLFLTKIAIECGIGTFTKTAAELQKRKENFKKELDFVMADVIMALVADFLLVWLPAPTFALRPPLALNVGPVAKFFYGCPDNAFQVAMAGSTYSVLQRAGALVRNGAKLFAVGATSSAVGTGVTNLLINARKAIDNSSEGEAAEDLPMVSTSLAYGTYLSISSNLRYQIVAGLIEQRILEPFLHDQKLLLSSMCFAVRTGNTFLGSLMWVDFARLVGLQRSRT